MYIKIGSGFLSSKEKERLVCSRVKIPHCRVVLHGVLQEHTEASAAFPIDHLLQAHKCSDPKYLFSQVPAVTCFSLRNWHHSLLIPLFL